MNAKRLLKLADFLDQLPRQKFDYSIIAQEGEKPMLEALKAREESCGTVACAIGWVPAIFPRLTKWLRLRNSWWKGMTVALKAKPRCTDFKMAQSLFGISEDDAYYLFDPGVNDLGANASAKRVARHIRRFVAQASK